MPPMAASMPSSPLIPPLPSSSTPLKFRSFPLSTASSSFPSSSSRIKCLARPYVSSDLNFVLLDALHSSGIDTTHAKEAREGFLSQIRYLSDIERETSISINKHVDLGKTALFIAAEDDSLISHSSVPLPVDAFVERLDDLSMGYCSHYTSSFSLSPETFLQSVEKYMFSCKSFRRTHGRIHSEPRCLYLHSVLTHRIGSIAMLSLIYSEILKTLRLWSLLDFDVEIFYPHDVHSLPRGYHKQKSKESDQPHIMTTQRLLVEILGNLKDAFWPFRRDGTGSLFLSAAQAAYCGDRSNIVEDRGLELASAKAAQHRLERGVWTSVPFGDMRRALSACERLIILNSDPKELRDYSILLYHCGFYKQSMEYLKLYQDIKAKPQTCSESPDSLSQAEEEAAEKLRVRLDLMATTTEEGWIRAPNFMTFLSKTSEPW